MRGGIILGMKASELKKKYIEFFKNKGHILIPSASLIPENDPSALFISAGMHPLVPYLLGEPHPEGKRLVSNQICLRTGAIDEVGDTFHHTFFEMLGNWSLGDYWKKEAIEYSFEFLTKELDLKKDRIWVTCFAGDKNAPKDEESAEIWEKIGIPSKRIFFYGKEDNWWGPAGDTGPCGPNSEMFYDVTGKACGENCKPGDDCGRFFEIWNDVFMQYNKTSDGKFVPLKQKSVDTGMGVERTTAVLQGLEDVYQVEDLWGKIMASIEEVTKTTYKGNEKAYRVIADHIRASTFVLAEGIAPSNKERGYVLRRLIRRAVRFGRVLGKEEAFVCPISQVVINSFNKEYPKLKEEEENILSLLREEEEKFMLTLKKGLREIEKIDKLDGKKAFFLYETYGFPLELTEEIAKEKGQKIDKGQFENQFEKHKSLSRTASSGMFKGGLADSGEEVIKLHTTTHLLHASLRKVLGDHVTQKGSNITKERLRFDFSHNAKLTDEELKQVENMVNEVIEKDLPVSFETRKYEEALGDGALAFFGEKYGERVKVYTVGDPGGKWFSKEVCGGPHVISTGKISRVRIKKQKKIGSGLIRLYAEVSKD